MTHPARTALLFIGTLRLRCVIAFYFVFFIKRCVLQNDVSDAALRFARLFPEFISLIDKEPRTTIWGEQYWKVFLYTMDDILQKIHYVEQNPVKAGLKPQRWSFVRRFPRRARSEVRYVSWRY